MPTKVASDRNALHYNLAKQAFEQGNYAKCFEFASALGSAIPVDLKPLAAIAAYKVALALAAGGKFRDALGKMQFASQVTACSTLRKLCADRQQLLRRSQTLPRKGPGGCPYCVENRTPISEINKKALARGAQARKTTSAEDRH